MHLKGNLGRRIKIFGFVACFSMMVCAQSLAEITNYVPKLSVPEMLKAPVIDGIMLPGEWDGAAAGTGFQTIVQAKLLPIQPVFYIGYDNENLYICICGPVTPTKMSPKQKRRNGGMFNDDSFELWLNPHFGTHDGMYKGYYQMIGNALGTIYDVFYKPGIGQTYPGWNGKWQFKNSVTDEIWTAEVAIAFKELEVETPGSGTQWNANFCRDFAGWHQFTSWSFTNDFSSISKMGELTFHQGIPAVQVLSLGKLGNGRLAARFGVYQQDSKETWLKAKCEVLDKEDKILLKEEKDIQLDGEKHIEFELSGQFTVSPDLRVNVEVSGPGGSPIYHAFNVPVAEASEVVSIAAEKPAKIYTGYFPYSGWVKAKVELGAELNPDNVKQVTMTLFSKKSEKPLATANASLFKEGIAFADAKVGELPEGEYDIVVSLKDSAGKTIYEERQPYERKYFPWEHNRLGISDTIVSPFTPIVSEPPNFSVLLRDYTIGVSGLPSQVKSAGEEMLAKPFRWVAVTGGKKISATDEGDFKMGKQAENEVTWQAKTKLGELEISTECTLEYDGMIRTELTLSPSSPVDVERFTLEVPFKKETGQFLSAWTSGYPRWNGKIPEADDFDVPVWGSKEMNQEHLIGTFVPLIWVGNDERGLHWFANSDEGWILDDERSCQEIVQRYKQVVLQLHFINKKVHLSNPHKIVFGLIATPVKAFPEGWRRWFAPGDSSFGGKDVMSGFGGNWPGQSAINGGIGTKNPEETRNWVKSHSPSPGSRVAGYMGVNQLPVAGLEDEHKTFGAEWNGVEPSGTDMPQSHIDIRVWYWKRLMQETGLNGGYWDGPLNYAVGTEPITGGAYIRDDGQLQPVHRIFECRQFHKRVATLHQELGVPSFHIAHSTGGPILPVISFMQVILGGEDPGMSGDKSPDLLDLWRLDRYRTELGKQWGIPSWVLIMTHTEPDTWVGSDPAPTRSGIALCLLHDTSPCVAYGHPYTAKRVADVKEEFGLGENDVSFIPYWQNKVKSTDVNIVTSVYRRSKKALVVPVNIGEKRSFQTLDLSDLGLGSIYEAKDGETGENLTPRIEGSKLTFFIGRHDYRMIMLKVSQ